MITPEIPKNEKNRLSALLDLEVLGNLGENN
jgi:hypothetical protein